VAASGADVPEPVAACLRQLEAYFAGRLTRFDVALDLGGTPFQRRVWAALMAVPYGSTTTYGTIAASLGEPAAMRAVGGANHRNPVSIIVPCHRVLGASGELTGYGGGLWRKAWLLAHERKHASR
jgi:methylated-DNA-[protein]-cysteine S-methyltransferase